MRDFLKLQLIPPTNVGPTALKIRKKRKKKTKKKKDKSKKKKKKKQSRSRTEKSKEEEDIVRRDAERQRREEMMAQEMEFVPQAAEDVLDEEEWKDIFEDETCEDEGGDFDEDTPDNNDDDDDEFDDVIEL